MATRSAIRVEVLLVLLAAVGVQLCPEDFFEYHCERRDYKNANPKIPQSEPNRTSCVLVVDPDYNYTANPAKVEIVPGRSVTYKLPNTTYSLRYVRKCGHYVYKVIGSPQKGAPGSTTFYHPTDEQPDTGYQPAVTCKKGKTTGRYVEILRPLSPDGIDDLSEDFGIDITNEEIKECLEEAKELFSAPQNQQPSEISTPPPPK